MSSGELASSACAQVVDASSEVLPECAAANVLDDDVRNLWLSNPGMPQQLTICINAKRPVRQIGLHCWHSFDTNPHAALILSSEDGWHFTVRASIECALTDQLQVFELSQPIPARDRFVRIAIQSTHGGERTYLNRILMRADDLLSPQSMLQSEYARGMVASSRESAVSARTVHLEQPSSRRSSLGSSLDVERRRTRSPARSPSSSRGSPCRPSAQSQGLRSSRTGTTPRSAVSPSRPNLPLVADELGSGVQALHSFEARRQKLARVLVQTEAALALAEDDAVRETLRELRSAILAGAQKLRSVEASARAARRELSAAEPVDAQAALDDRRTLGLRAQAAFEPGAAGSGGASASRAQPPLDWATASASSLVPGASSALPALVRREVESGTELREVAEIHQIVRTLEMKLQRKAELLAQLRSENGRTST